MEPVLLYGHPLGSSMGLVAALEWLGEPYRLSRVDMLSHMKTPAYRRLNDRGETPALRTEHGRVLTETMAIALWMEARDDRRRISPEPGSWQSQLMHQVMGFVNSSFTPAFSAYWAAYEDASMNDADKAVLRAFGHRQVNKRHDQLERMLGDTPFAIGDDPTLADALFVGVARWADFHAAIEPVRYPKVRALKERVERQPAVRFALSIEAGDHPPGVGAMLGQTPLAAIEARV